MAASFLTDNLKDLIWATWQDKIVQEFYGLIPSFDIFVIPAHSLYVVSKQSFTHFHHEPLVV